MINLNFKVLLVLLLLLSGCAEEPVMRDSRPVVVQPRQVMPPAKDKVSSVEVSRDVFIVKKGDTLYSIGFGSGVGYELLSKWNKIPKPYKLYVGQIIKLYDSDLSNNEQPEQVETAQAVRSIKSSKVVTPPPLGIQAQTKPSKPNSTIITVAPSPLPPKSIVPDVRKTPAPAAEISGDSKDKEKSLKLYWKWPIQGKILKNFVQSGNKGIDIEAKIGDSVRAAAKGDVVYSGNGLIGYGNLLIIMHDDLHLSAYANNASLLVNEGQKVSQGQVIARCGKSASGVPSLHFEIRKNGKSVNPLLYLPTP